MRQATEAQLLRIFVGEDKKVAGKPLYQVIVERAKQEKLAGATVLRGLLGFGAHSHMHTHKILRISENLPLVIEIVDSAEKIEKFMEILDEFLIEAYVTLEKVSVYKY
jgi:PII-like signaling protein